MVVSAGRVVTVRDVLGVLQPWQARLVAGEQGLGRTVTWASAMRARTPAFDTFEGGELALLSLATLRMLRSQLVTNSLASVVSDLIAMGASAIAVAGLGSGHAAASADDAGDVTEALARASRAGVPLLALAAPAPLAELEREVIALVVARREQPAPRGAGDALSLRASLRDEALEALLTGTYAGEASMLSRAAQLGYDLHLPHAVLHVVVPGESAGAMGDGRAASPSTGVARGTIGAVGAVGAVGAIMERLAGQLAESFGAWVRAGHGEVVALLPLREAGDPGALLERLAGMLRRALGMDGWSAGLGEVARAPLEVRRSGQEARDAARLALLALGPGQVARPSELGIYHLLLVLRDGGELRPFVERELAPLLADRRQGLALVETIETYFACNGNLSEAARQLHLHRNSLIYRLNRARELLGHDLENPERRLALQLALKGRRVLET